MKRLFLIILILAWASVGWGADRNIYISSSAASGGDGTIETPFDQFSDLNWTTIANYVTAGDDVYINLQGTFTTLLTVGASGASGHPITIQSYGSGATISRNIIVPSWSGPDGNGYYYVLVSALSDTPTQVSEDSTFLLRNTNTPPNGAAGTWARLDPGGGLTFYYRPTTGTPSDHTLVIVGGYCIQATNRSYITVSNINLIGATAGILFDTTGGHHNVNNCTASYCTTAVFFSNQNSGNCFVDSLTATYCGNGVYFGATAGANIGDDGYVKNSTFRYINKDNISTFADGHAVGIQYCENIIIQDNIMDWCKSPISLYSNDATNPVAGTIIKNNRISNSKYTVSGGLGAAIAFSSDTADEQVIGNTVIGNVIDNCTIGIYSRYGSSTDHNIVSNNTIMNCTRGTYFRLGGDYNELNNNVFYNNTIHHYWYDATTNAGTNNASNYNSYYPDGANLFYYRSASASDNFADWKTDSSQDANSLASDPKVLSSGKLRIGSPCKSAGTSIAGVNDTGTDIWGNSSFRTNIGAYWGSGVIPGGVLDIGNGKKGGVFRIGR